MRYPLLVDVNTSTTQRRLVMGFTILGTGSALPERSVSNDELSEFLDPRMSGFLPAQVSRAATSAPPSHLTTLP